MPKHIRVECPHCATSFEVPASLQGGHTNCTNCRKAVEVGGSGEDDWVFWGLVGMGGLFVLALSVGVMALGSIVGGLSILGVGGLIILIIVLAS